MLKNNLSYVIQKPQKLLTEIYLLVCSSFYNIWHTNHSKSDQEDDDFSRNEKWDIFKACAIKTKKAGFLGFIQDIKINKFKIFSIKILY